MDPEGLNIFADYDEDTYGLDEDMDNFLNEETFNEAGLEIWNEDWHERNANMAKLGSNNNSPNIFENYDNFNNMESKDNLNNLFQNLNLYPLPLSDLTKPPGNQSNDNAFHPNHSYYNHQPKIINNEKFELIRGSQTNVNHPNRNKNSGNPRSNKPFQNTTNAVKKNNLPSHPILKFDAQNRPYVDSNVTAFQHTNNQTNHYPLTNINNFASDHEKNFSQSPHNTKIRQNSNFILNKPLHSDKVEKIRNPQKEITVIRIHHNQKHDIKHVNSKQQSIFTCEKQNAHLPPNETDSIANTENSRYTRADYSKYSTDSENYDGLMLKKERALILKIQLSLLQSRNPLQDDYYYSVSMMRHILAKEPGVAFSFLDQIHESPTSFNLYQEIGARDPSQHWLADLESLCRKIPEDKIPFDITRFIVPSIYTPIFHTNNHSSRQTPSISNINENADTNSALNNVSTPLNGNSPFPDLKQNTPLEIIETPPAFEQNLVDTKLVGLKNLLGISCKSDIPGNVENATEVKQSSSDINCITNEIRPDYERSNSTSSYTPDSHAFGKVSFSSIRQPHVMLAITHDNANANSVESQNYQDNSSENNNNKKSLGHFNAQNLSAQTASTLTPPTMDQSTTNKHMSQINRRALAVNYSAINILDGLKSTTSEDLSDFLLSLHNINSGTKYRHLLLNIEKMYDILVTFDDPQKKIIYQSIGRDIIKENLQDPYCTNQILILWKRIFPFYQINIYNNGCATLKSGENLDDLYVLPPASLDFIKLLCVEKGKRLINRLIPYLDEDCFIYLMAECLTNLHIFTKCDLKDKDLSNFFVLCQNYANSHTRTLPKLGVNYLLKCLYDRLYINPASNDIIVKALSNKYIFALNLIIILMGSTIVDKKVLKLLPIYETISAHLSDLLSAFIQHFVQLSAFDNQHINWLKCELFPTLLNNTNKNNNNETNISANNSNSNILALPNLCQNPERYINKTLNITSNNIDNVDQSLEKNYNFNAKKDEPPISDTVLKLFSARMCKMLLTD